MSMTTLYTCGMQRLTAAEVMIDCTLLKRHLEHPLDGSKDPSEEGAENCESHKTGGRVAKYHVPGKTQTGTVIKCSLALQCLY